MKSKISVIIVAVLILSLSVASFGAMGVEEIKAFMANDMKFQVNGEMWQPKDADGTAMYPIIYKDRSYIPVRALLEERDVKVDYDAKTRTIMLNDPDDPFDEDKNDWDPPRDTTEVPGYEPPVGENSSPYYIQKSNIGGPYKEWPNYDILFETIKQPEGPGIISTIQMELADDAMLMINGKETNLKELKEGQIDYYFTISPKDKITVGVDPKTKLLKSLVMDVKLRDPSEKEKAMMMLEGEIAGEIYITMDPQEEVYYGKVTHQGKEIKR
jgi:hypothetical protein